jgi:hypothetical protein
MALMWTVLAAAILTTVGLLVMRRAGRRDGVALLRRRLLIGVVLCAASFVGACRRIGAGQPPTPQNPTKLSVLARLGEIWRTMGRHARGEARDAGRYEALGEQMKAALADLKGLADKGRFNPASAAVLDHAFRERHSHTAATHYPRATCYEMTVLGGDFLSSLSAVEQQTKILHDLAKKGKLPTSAIEKARKVVAKELAFQMQVQQLWAAKRDSKAEQELHKSYESGDIEPAEATTEAAEILVDFTTKPTGSA